MAHSHIESHFTQSLALRDLVIGISDGLTVPFALAAGLSHAVDSTHVILVAGFAEVIAGSLSMGLGGYLAGRTEVEHYQGELKREMREVNEIPEVEKQEIRELFQKYPLSPQTIEGMVQDLEKDKKAWVDFMMKFELGMEEPNPSQASRSALRIGLAYGFGGAVPLAPYIWASSTSEGLWTSSILTLFSLAAFGALKGKFTGQAILKSAFKMTLIGALAAYAAFLSAKWIGILLS